MKNLQKISEHRETTKKTMNRFENNSIQSDPESDSSNNIKFQGTLAFKNLEEVINGNTGENIAKRCIILIKEENGFALKVIGCNNISEDKKDTKNYLNAQIELGTFVMELYCLVMEDFCKAMVNYKELYGLRDSSGISNSEKSISKANQLDDEDNDNLIKQREFKNCSNSLLTYIDEFAFRTNVNLSLKNKTIRLGIFDSTKNSKGVIINGNPFSLTSIPSGNLTLIKKKDVISLALFDFEFHTNKPAAFTSFFCEVILYINYSA